MYFETVEPTAVAINAARTRLNEALATEAEAKADRADARKQILDTLEFDTTNYTVNCVDKSKWESTWTLHRMSCGYAKPYWVVADDYEVIDHLVRVITDPASHLKVCRCAKKVVQEAAVPAVLYRAAQKREYGVDRTIEGLTNGLKAAEAKFDATTESDRAMAYLVEVAQIAGVDVADIVTAARKVTTEAVA